MTRRSSRPSFHIHMSGAFADVAIFVFSFVAVAVFAGLAANLVPWS